MIKICINYKKCVKHHGDDPDNTVAIKQMIKNKKDWHSLVIGSRDLNLCGHIHICLEILSRKSFFDGVLVARGTCFVGNAEFNSVFGARLNTLLKFHKCLQLLQLLRGL